METFGDLYRDPPAWVAEWSLWLTAVVGGMIAVGWIGVRLRRLWRLARGTWNQVARRFDALDRLVTHELTHNSGGSMKDAVDRLEDAQTQHLTEASQAFREIDQRLGHLEGSLAVQAEAQHNIWPAIEAVARARPPDDDPPTSTERES